ncbi:hypothetical protein OBV_12140 [Oscillibacter valericigenes Sjm18-20]|nr:hypothetical protein OBV_12140 [Oscillibacter valericigenes Sjm18-20]
MLSSLDRLGLRLLFGRQFPDRCSLELCRRQREMVDAILRVRRYIAGQISSGYAFACPKRNVRPLYKTVSFLATYVYAVSEGFITRAHSTAWHRIDIRQNILANTLEIHITM